MIYITICTNRKKKYGGISLDINNLPCGTQTEVTSIWLEKINSAKKVAEAQNVYCGRGFLESLIVSKIINTTPWIISGGLGLVHGLDRVPEYNLTIIPNTLSSIQQRVSTFFCPNLWWTSLNKKLGRSLANLIKENSKSIVLLSLSQIYAKMVQEDLLKLDDTSLKKLRIVGLSHAEILHKRLQHAFMPYDTRINNPKSGISGTMSDFPQRAAHHFVNNIWGDYPTVSATNHAALVKKSLAHLKKPVIPVRKQMNNEEIKVILTKNWDKAQGHSGKMLRFLRDQLMIACEQKRFSFLFKQVKEIIEHE